MKRKTICKLNYLEEALRLNISIIEEDENALDSKAEWTILDYNGNEITGFRKIMTYIFLPVMLILIFVIQLPFLLIINLLKIFYGIKNGIPIELIPIVLPAKRVDLIKNKIKIEIRHNEHPPPHFHIIIDKEDYPVEILTGRYLHNEIKNTKHKKAVAKWYVDNKQLLIKTWNETRPTNCPVGKIQKTATNK